MATERKKHPEEDRGAAARKHTVQSESQAAVLADPNRAREVDGVCDSTSENRCT